MASIPLRIVFMGTPDFAVPALTAIHGRGHHVVCVVTQPDRPKGRGRLLTPPPVKNAAAVLGLPVIQPATIRSAEALHDIRRLAPDALVVVAYGQIIPAALLKIPRLGPINIHASLLPKFRGAAPIQWAIITGERETGVTTMLMDTGVDTGDILLSAATPIADTDTSQSLHDRLATMGGELILDTLEGLAQGAISPVPQNPAYATLAPMLKKSDGAIDWTAPAATIAARIRGLTPWPGAFTTIDGKRISVLEATVVPMPESAMPGTVLRRFQNQLVVAAGSEALAITRVQGASGKTLVIADYLRGRPICPGTVLT
ncbi:MAG: methionyl-tRNA formyltransferase [Pseudomonadota bacterium]